MRRSLTTASVAALVATLLTATPAAADELGQVAQQIARQPSEVPAADAVVAPVSADAHPVTPEMELVAFGEDPVEGTPEALAIEAEEQGETPAPENATTEDVATTQPDEATDTAAASTLTSSESASVEVARSPETVDDAMTEGDGTDDPAGTGGTAGTETDSESTEQPEGEPTAEATDEPDEDSTTGLGAEIGVEEHTDHDHGDEGHEHAEETPEPEGAGATLAEQLYAASGAPEVGVLGVTWAPGTAPADLVVEVRTRTDDEWSAWEPLHVEANETRDDEAEIDARDGTMPLALIGVQAAEVRLASDTAMPEEPSLAIVDPGESTADAAPVTMSTMAAPAASRPTIYSRAQWGADERLMTWTPSQGRVQGIDIHHTVNANDYSADQVPALMRSIYVYHANGRGWGDIGYNFVVDRFGRIWEGRYGGVDQAPIGAHATGLNSNFSGISLLGNFDTVAVPAAAFTAVARLAAWKLALHGITTSGGTVTVEAGTFARINGHRDSKQTTCPGRYMYNRLGEMRSLISSYLGSFADRQLDRDLDGDGAPDLVVTNGTVVSLMSTVDRGTWASRVLGNSGWTSRTVTPGDWNGDGRNDIILVDAQGRMWLYAGLASGGIDASSRVRIGTGWASFTTIMGGVDWDGDRRLDLVARHKDGTLRLYRGNGSGGFLGSSVIGKGWNGFTSLTLAPAFVGGRPAVLAERAGVADLMVYPGNGSGGFSSAIVATRQWAAQRQATGVGDATGDGRGDVVSVDTAGVLWLYPGTSTGGVDAANRIKIGTGWRDFTVRSHWAVGAEGLALLGINAAGKMSRYGWTYDRAAFSDLSDTGVRVTAGSRVAPVGDWNGDGRPDLVVVAPDGKLRLHAGTGGGRFAASGVQIGTGWAGMSAIVGAGNWRGDVKPGIIAYQRANGRLWYYPGNGSGGFGSAVLISTGASGMNYLVNAGRWNLGGAPDLLMRGADTGRLFFYDGNGPGLALPPVIVGQGWGSMRSIVGVNDISGDGRPDLVAVSGSGAVVVYRGNGAGGFQSGATTVGSLPSGAVVS